MATIPSIAMIPSGYKAGKVYSVLPTNGDADLTFTRASEATRVNENGLIEEVLSNVPRLDYSDGGCPSLLVEPQRTNLLLRSEEFDNASWVKTNSTITANAAVSPDGTLSADIIARAGVGSRVTQDTSSVLPTNQSSFSLYAKRYSNNSGLTIRIEDASSSTNNYSVTVNLELNTISGFTSGNGVLSSSSIEDVGNGWYKLNLSGIPNTSGTTTRVAIYTTTTTIGEGVYIWGAQLEAGSNATSYIPTVASTVTRIAETVSKTGLSSYINSNEGVLFVEIAALADDLTTRRITLSDGSSNNRIILQYQNSSNKFRGLLVSSGVTQFDTGTITETITNFNKVALKYKENDFSLWINGIEVYSDLTGSTFSTSTLNKISFDDGTGANNFYGKVKNLQVFNTALSDLEIETITSYTSFEEMALALNYTIEITL